MKSPTITDQAIGQRIKALRLQRGLTQKKVGEALGVTFRQVQKYEDGTNRISASKLPLLASLFGVSQLALLPDGTDAKPDQLSALSSEAYALAEAFDSLPEGEAKAAMRWMIKCASDDAGAAGS